MSPDSETEKQIEAEDDARIEAEEKARQEAEAEKARQEAARKKGESNDDDLDKRIKRHVKGLFTEIEAGRYVDCPGCGDRILKKNKSCKRCQTRFNPSTGKWEKDTPEQTKKLGVPWLH